MIKLLLSAAMIVLPQTITVRVTGQTECYYGIPYHIEEVAFKDYVKGVMMNEFGDQHPVYGVNGERLDVVPHSDETLETAAMVIKNYALHQYYTGGKWGGYEEGIVYDCDWDMVYNPNITRPRTDKAVDDTWGLVLLYEDTQQIVPTYFNAYYNGCIETHGAHGKCLAQWGWGGVFSKGDRGLMMEEILRGAYDHTEIVDIARAKEMLRFSTRTRSEK